MANEKILVVDDDVNICELLRLYLEKEGYTVSIVNDGESAVKSFGEIQPDLMLLDIMLPRLDGWQVCREIRKFSDKPIIMLTAKGGSPQTQRGRSSGGYKAGRIRQAQDKPDELRALGRRQAHRHSAQRVGAYLSPCQQPEQGVHPRSAARRSLWLRLLRRFENGRCPCQEAQREARGRVRQVGTQDRLERRLQV